MRSFKQYLTETSGPIGEVSFTVDVNCEYNLGHRKIAAFERRLSKNLLGYTIEVMDDDMTAVVKLYKLNASNGSQQALEHVLEAVVSAAEDIFTDDIEYDSYLACEGFPPFKLEWRHIYISCQPNQTLTGIDKMIDLNETVTFHDVHNITNGVLSLLKIKHGHISLSSSKPPKWQSIVQQHLNGNKDIVACQEELFKNGLKEFAKL